MTSLTKITLDQLWSWNAQVPAPTSTSVQELIRQRAEMRNDQPAIIAWDGSYSYGQLVHLASNLADHLLQNVCPHHGRVLPIVMNKSKWMPIAMLGALMGGWGIAPLDVNTPAARLAKILEILDPPCILTIDGARIDVDTIVPVLLVDRLRLNDCSLGDVERRIGVTMANVAAVVFTSGSTGPPKGVMLGSECISTAAVCGSQILQLGPGSRLFQFSSFSFDISLHEIFFTLVAGGCLCIPSEAERLNDPIAAIKELQANCICTTPSVMMSVLADTIASTPIKTVVLTGEALTARIDPLFDCNTQIFSWYGASECPIVALTPLTKEKWTASQISSRHPGNCWVTHSEDPDVLCGFGEVGELLVESPMLALGFLNNPKQTGTAFVVDPVWLARGYGSVTGRRSRLYRTGDLVRNNQDGTFDYLGRKDTLVKIRGQRVELSAVEHYIWDRLRSGSLKSSIEATEVVVEALDSGRGNDGVRMACFLHVRRKANSLPQTPSPKLLTMAKGLHSTALYAPDAAVQALQSELDCDMRLLLPGYMVPSVYFQLSEVPFTPSGKIDRRLLRALAAQIPGLHSEECLLVPRNGNVLPQNEMIEMELQRIWSQVLGVEAAAINTTTSFLRCGGDSLSSIVLAKALMKNFQLSVKVPQLLSREATIQYLATLMRRCRDGQASDEPRLDVATVLGQWLEKIRGLYVRHPAAQPLGHRGSRILLTGATGYLGTHILRELVNSHWVSKVIVLVRGADVACSRQRVRDVATTAGWWQESAFSRIEVWVGSLTEPRLGLQEEEWEQVSAVHMIIHNGAVVNYSAGYGELEAGNVTSTFYLLQAALRSRHLRCFIFISGGIKQGHGQSDAEHLRAINESEGYSQTKYISEQLTLAAGRQYNEVVQPYSAHGDKLKPENRGRTFAVVKPGYIIGDQLAGLSNTDDFIWKLVAGSIRMRCFPSDPPDYWLDIAEVTHVARCIVHQAQLRASNPPSGLIMPLISSHSGKSSPSCEDLRENGATDATVVFKDLIRGLPVHLFWRAVQSQARLSLEPKDWRSWMDQAHLELERDKDAHPLWGIQLHLGPSLGIPSRISAEEVEARVMEASDALQDIEAAVRRCVQYLFSIRYIVLPFKAASLHSSHPHCEPAVDDTDDATADNLEHLSKRGDTGRAQGQQHPLGIGRSKLTH